MPERGDPVIVSSRVIERGQPEGVCGGLVLDMGVGPSTPGRVLLRLPITNRTAFDWHGTVGVRFGDTAIPVDIGEIKTRETRAATIELKVSPGEVEVEGSLLIGP